MSSSSSAGFKAWTGLVILLLAGAAYLVANPGSLNAAIEQLGGTQQQATSQAQVEHTGVNDYYTVLGEAQRDYVPSKHGTVEFCPADEQSRTSCAYGLLTGSQRQAAQTAGRQDMNVDPLDWPGNNEEVMIAALGHLDDSSSYSGWFWNRSHLIADSLGGPASVENLITGTRTQNVGSTRTSGQYAGGMAYTELIARDYLDADPSYADNCPLYYAATPVYTGTERLPRTVLVDIQNCDTTIDMRVEVFNSAQGFAIDYTTGDYHPVD